MTRKKIDLQFISFYSGLLFGMQDSNLKRSVFKPDELTGHIALYDALYYICNYALAKK